MHFVCNLRLFWHLLSSVCTHTHTHMHEWKNTLKCALKHFSCPVTNSKRALRLYFTTSRSFPVSLSFSPPPSVPLLPLTQHPLPLSKAKGSRGERSVVAGLQIKFHMTEHLFWCSPLERKYLKELACLSLGEGLWSTSHQVFPIKKKKKTLPHTDSPHLPCLLVQGACFELSTLHDQVEPQSLLPFHALQYVWLNISFWKKERPH